MSNSGGPNSGRKRRLVESSHLSWPVNGVLTVVLGAFVPRLTNSLSVVVSTARMAAPVPYVITEYLVLQGPVQLCGIKFSSLILLGRSIELYNEISVKLSNGGSLTSHVYAILT